MNRLERRSNDRRRSSVWPTVPVVLGGYPLAEFSFMTKSDAVTRYDGSKIVAMKLTYVIEFVGNMDRAVIEPRSEPEVDAEVDLAHATDRGRLAEER
jgi:hypothetical protein